MHEIGVMRVLFLYYLSTLLCTCSTAKANSPPKFALGISDIVVRIKEGPESVGKLLLHLIGEDADGDILKFGVSDPIGASVLRIENTNANEANVYLRKELDREITDSYSLVLTLTDGKLADGQFVRQSMLIVVEDVNDNEPIFKPYRSTISIKENAQPGIIADIEATDIDEGPFGQIIYQLQDLDDIRDTFSIQTSGGKGIIRLTGALDYENKSLYQLRVLAVDRANTGRKNTATAAILVKIEDVEDQPPVFIIVPPVTRIPEDLPIQSPVLTVKAVDGDRGVNNAIMYRIRSGSHGLFTINSNSGVVYVNKKLDRESTENRIGAFILDIEAQEVTTSVFPPPSVTTEATILLTDVNDETPTFKSNRYMAEINENAQTNVPVNFIGTSIAEVFDYDQGKNGTFRLSLLGDNDIFEVTPSEGVNEVSFLIRVKNSAALDFEKIKVINFKILAKETLAVGAKSSTAEVTVYIRDVNDNFPKFTPDHYRAVIPENVSAGTTIATIRAKDEDSGEFGTAGIRYTDVRGQIADKLHLDLITGELVVMTSEHGFDRETTSQYFVTIEAADNNGHGNKNTIQLQIILDDVNDNAPRFLQEKYEARINENNPKFLTSLIVQAQDDDLKGSANSEVNYKIAGGDEEENFTINKVTGEILPTKPLDFEYLSFQKSDVRTFSLMVQAYDLGQPTLFSEVPVTIYIHDMNDHAPVFQRSYYNKAISEDTPDGTSVLQVYAVDGDHSSSNSKVVYRIQSGAQDKFVIDADKGIISVSNGANLDPDRTIPKTTSYILQVIALDGGLGNDQKHAFVNVNISIIDVNNKPPIFGELPFSTVLENAPIGSYVAKITAIDLDDKPMLRYSIDYTKSEARNEDGGLVNLSEFDYSSLFEISAMDGTVKVAKQLDREETEIVKLHLQVHDLGAITSGQTATATLTIKIEDVNDNVPIFHQPFYKQAVRENSKIGAPIATFVAKDADLNRTLTYSLMNHGQMAGAENMDWIRIHPTSGEISVNSKIDREMFSWLNITIVATDNGIPPLSGTTELYLQILDENDNNPIFIKGGQREFLVSEDTKANTEVALVQAVDADSGDYGKITYILDSISAQGKFRMNRDTGAISIAEELDREQVALYTLIVQAWDNYEYGFATGESRKAFKQITIKITDINDHYPIFLKHDVCSYVTEFHQPGDTIMMISANDADDPNTPNARIFFTIIAGNENNLFVLENLDFNTARVILQESLQGKFGNYTLTIQAQDMAKMPLLSIEKFHICVTDVNDNAPKFLKPPFNYTIRIPENSTLGSEVVAVEAVDNDSGLNGDVRYRLKRLSNMHYETFRIDEETGILTLGKLLDRETQKLYELRVEAYDLGLPTSLSSDLDLTIFVTNVDDNEPEFTEDVYNVMFTENTPAGREKFKLIPTIDKDDDSNSPKPSPIPCYFIVGGNYEGNFKLDIFTHQLFTTRPLDREERENYTLIVKASDECFHTPAPVTKFNSKDNTLLQVLVGVRDINDNPPKFIKSVFTGGVTTDTDFGSIFMSVKAVDRDMGSNAVIRYYIIDRIQRTLSEGLDSVRGPPFLINHETGEINLNFDPQKGMKGYFDFQILANDTDGLNDTARVFIYLLREDQRVRFVLRLNPEELRIKLEKFREVLSNITGAIVNVDDYKYHENRDGSVDKKLSDLYVHFVNREDNSIMEVNTVISLIDKNLEFLNELYKEFHIILSEPAEAVKLDNEDQMKAWLISVAVFLAIMLTLVIALCLTQRNRYERKLKAATATAFGSQDTVINRIDVPNTNQHSVEGSNPIWMHAYDNNWYKDDDDVTHRSEDNNSLDENAVEVNAAQTTDAYTANNTNNEDYPPTLDRSIRNVQLRSEAFHVPSRVPRPDSSPLGHDDDNSQSVISQDVQQQNDLNKTTKNYLFGSNPTLYSTHIANLETSEL